MKAMATPRGRTRWIQYRKNAVRRAVRPRAVLNAVDRGDVELIVITVPNIIGTPGIEFAGLLPPELPER